MKKGISYILAAVCLLLCCGCAAANMEAGPGTTNAQPTTTGTTGIVLEPTTLPPETMPEVPYFDLALMPSSRKAEIEEAYKRQIDPRGSLDWEDGYDERFYGDFGHCVVIYSRADIFCMERIEVAGYLFVYGSAANIYVYADGVFCHLKEAYENGMLTQEQISLVHQQYAKHDGR